MIDAKAQLLKACEEAFLYMTCPAGSARDTPINRGNLTRLLEKALAAAAAESPAMRTTYDPFEGRAAVTHRPADAAPYPFCRNRDKTPNPCAGKGYCPNDPACND